MSRGPRVFLSLIIAIVLMIVYIKLQNIPVDKLAPPSMMYKNAVGSAQGTITGKNIGAYGDHIMEGDTTYYFVTYQFNPTYTTHNDKGKRIVTKDPVTYQGTVRVTHDVYDKIDNGLTVNVRFDPDNPAINGAIEPQPDTGTFTPDPVDPAQSVVWSKTTGFWNPYLYYYLVVLIMTAIIQEIIRMMTKTNDMRA